MLVIFFLKFCWGPWPMGQWPIRHSQYKSCIRRVRDFCIIYIYIYVWTGIRDCGLAAFGPSWTIFWDRFGCCFDSSIRLRCSESIQWSDSSIRLDYSVRGFDSLLRFFDSVDWFDSSMRFVQNMIIDLHSLCTAWRNARSDSIRRPPRRGGAERVGQIAKCLIYNTSNLQILKPQSA